MRYLALLALLSAAPLDPQAYAPHSPPAAQDSAEPAPPEERYLRSVEDPEGRWASLEIAIREFVPGPDASEPDGPHLFLVGAAHVASADFFDELSAFFDGCDVVLFEGVRPEDQPAPEASPRNEAWRARASARRLRAAERRVAAWYERHRTWPEGLDQVFGPGDPLGDADAGARDGWGRPLRYSAPLPGERGLLLESLGADGEPGGTGPNRDLALSDQPELVLTDSGHADGLQSKLAKALGLVFQLDAVDSTEPGWVNCDMTVEALRGRLEQEQVDASLLFGALDGSSVLARLQGKLLDLMGSTKTGSGALRLIGLELLGRADELFEAAPGELGQLMDVILLERNRVVVAGVRKLLAEHGTQLDRVAIFYGAGHLRDLEQRCVRELGYVPVGDTWIEAFRVEFDDLGLASRQASFLRRTVRAQLDIQLALGRRLKQQRARSAESQDIEPTDAEPEDAEEGQHE